MYKAIITVGFAMALAGCSSIQLGCYTGQTIASVDVTGQVVYTKLMGKCLAPVGGFSSLSAGPMPAPPSGTGWSNLFR